MPEGSYTSDGLRTGGGTADDAASAADRVRSRLAGRAVTAGWFGGVNTAGRFATGLGAGRDDLAQTGATTAEVHSRLGTRSVTAAGHADRLTTDTQTTASAVAPGAITDGMR